MPEPRIMLERPKRYHVPPLSWFEERGISYAVDAAAPNWVAVDARGREVLEILSAEEGGLPEEDVVLRYAGRRALDAGRAWVHVHDFLAELERSGLASRKPFRRDPYPGRAALIAPEGLRELWIQINNACNISCAHCLVGSGPGESAGLPAERLASALREASALGLERVYVTGGEPFLRPDLGDLLRLAVDDLGLEAIVLTNAMLLGGRNRSVLESLDRSRVRFQVSLDGARPGTNDRIRGAGSHERALEGARAIVSLGFDVSLTTVVVEANLAELAEIPAIARSVGARSQHLMWSFGRGRATADRSAFLPDPGKLVAAVLETADAAERAGVALDNLEAVKRRVNGVPGVKYDLGNGGWDSLCLYHDGKVYPTAALAGERDLLCGDVLEDGFAGILERSPVVRRLRASSLVQNPAVADDPFRFFTGGGDWEHAWWRSGSAAGADPYYPVTLALIRRVMTALGEEKASRPGVRTGARPRVLHAMGEGAVACGNADAAAAESPVLTLHSNCVLSFDVDRPRSKVRDYYGAAAETPKAELCCPVRYDDLAVSHIPKEVIDRFYGCGSPVTLARIAPGETVLDLGSGAGIDVFIAAKLVGSRGRAIGVDMTGRMLAVARESQPRVAAALGYDAAEFREGFLEKIPAETKSVDVVLSNCVINLSPAKPRVFDEIWRVLKDHGRFVVSDIVSEREVPPRLKVNPDLWGECLVGALTEEAFLAELERSGFHGITILKRAFWKVVEGYPFFSLTVEGFKLERAAREEPEGHRAVYLGPGKAIVLEDGSRFPRNEPVPVSIEVAGQLGRRPYGDMFAVLAPGEERADFACCGTVEACCATPSEAREGREAKRDGEGAGSGRKSPVRLLLVGGFLGAGKTTLLWEAARRLVEQGKRVGLITNDQAPQLVDTELLLGEGLDVREVAGSCFCCNFQGLLDAARSLEGEVGADVLIAEPVGSCTDLSATILQPLKERYSGEFVLAPLSVLVDPERIDARVEEGARGLHPSAAYILQKQIEEADSIVVSKRDLLGPEGRSRILEALEASSPGRPVHFLSALTGEGVDEWLAAVLESTRSGSRIADVDYDTYAEGEAVLGWLNAATSLSSSRENTDWRALLRRFLEGLREAFEARSAEVGHVKLLLSSPRGRFVGNFTSARGRVSVRGSLPGRSPAEARLVVNARVEMAPEDLETLVRETLDRAAERDIRVAFQEIRSFRPGRPRPTHRYAAVI
jgi:MoaA/NifB/PqqE/SkfB family radical SAM enzyme/G3E family GTPase/SAM-dependent methyltransferase